VYLTQSPSATPSALAGTFPQGRIEYREKLIVNVQWFGRGCAISQASMSMMSELLIGKSIKELKLMMPGDVYKMLGIQITPSRVNCALLSYRALENILLKIML
jgi:nitrogen fixation protein NifU and related proteins